MSLQNEWRKIMGKSVPCRGNSMLGGSEGSTGVGGTRLLMIPVQSAGGAGGGVGFSPQGGAGVGRKKGSNRSRWGNSLS